LNKKNEFKPIKLLPYYLVPFWVGFLVFLMSYFPALLFALPQDGQIVAGNGNIQQPNSQNMVINQSSNQMITNWQGFNIGQTESVRFNQPGANSVALNRVIGQDPTAILGKLNANGQIFITNPSGVFFGPNSIINVGSLMATSLQISDQDFLNRNYRFTQDPSKSLASVINEGQINASGYIGLLGPRAENRGMLMANLGSIALGSGKAATMDFSGDGLINFAITEPVDGSFVDKDGNTVDNGAFNSGTIQADGGKVLLTAHTAQKMVRSVVNNTGVIRAQSVSKRNGAIYLEAGPNGTATNEGTIDASGTDSGETGGTVHILGDKVGQLGTASIDVSGDQGGGEVLIGGDYQGKGFVQNASVTFGGSNTTVKANAITNGNGGKVIYWADDTTRFYGAIEAKGGANSGDGGFVEVSGKRFLDFNGDVVTTAANGQTGTLLLDPDDIIIVDQLSDDDDPEISGDHEIFKGDGSRTFSISVAALEGLNATNDIILQANDSITFNDLADNIFDLQTTSNNSVTFQTTNGAITFLDTNDLLRTQGGSINFSAGGALTLGMLESNGGDINLSSESSIHTYGIASRGGFVGLSAESGINVKRNIMTGGGDFAANADFNGSGTGTYTQDSPAFINTSGGSVVLFASDFDFLNGYTGTGDVFGVPSSIITHSFSLANGFESSNSITIAPSVTHDTICVGTTTCGIELDQNEITSLRTSTLNIGDLFSGTISFGDIDLGNKETNFISGINIEGSASKIIFRDDISFAAVNDISFTSGSNIEPHISGFSKSIEFASVNFTLDSSSSITTLGGDVSIAATSKDLSGQINLNGGELTFPSGESVIDEILEDLFSDLDGFPDDPGDFPDDPGGFPDDPGDFPFDLFDPIFDDILLDQENLDILGAIPGLTAEDFAGIIGDKDQAQQVSVLGDFLDNGSGKPGC
jgi:filamentous hemagglutinin family protein